MTLNDVAKELFAYLSIFRIQVEAGFKQTSEEVQKELLDIFRRQEVKVRQNPALSNGYNQIRYPLVVFADDVILNSDWEYAGDWGSKLLERRFFETEVGGDRFFELSEDIEMDDPEVASVYCMCLSLGFRGRYEQGAEELRLIKQDLLDKCPYSTGDTEEPLYPQAYASSIMKSHKLPRVLKWRHIAYLLLVLLGIYLTLDRVIIWNYLTASLQEVSTDAAAILETGNLPLPAALPTSEVESNRYRKSQQSESTFSTALPTASGSAVKNTIDPGLKRGIKKKSEP
jgi:type IV/VI secretion system ImpK/VasF family protein